MGMITEEVVVQFLTAVIIFGVGVIAGMALATWVTYSRNIK